MPKLIPAGAHRTGLVFAPAAPGALAWNVELLGGRQLQRFAFAAKIPGFRADCDLADLEGRAASRSLTPDWPGLQAISTQSVRAVGWVDGVGAATRDESRRNLTGYRYFTDGLRAVIFLSSSPVPTASVRRLPGYRHPFQKRFGAGAAMCPGDIFHMISRSPSPRRWDAIFSSNRGLAGARGGGRAGCGRVASCRGRAAGAGGG